MNPRRRSRTGLLLALAALLGQLWIASPHVTRELAGALAPVAQRLVAAHVDVEESASCAAGHHDAARCPLCEAFALARSAVTSSADTRPIGILSPDLGPVAFGYDHLPSAPADLKNAARAPPSPSPLEAA